MGIGFYWVIVAQFFSSLADNALLIVAIALLTEILAPDWMTPLLKFGFTLSYVFLAPFVGAFADALPKGRVMFWTNSIKIAGLALMMFSVHPLLAYALVGLGAAAYSPAKYGILTEMLPAPKLVIANSWIEAATVSSIVLGAAVGGLLVSGGFLRAGQSAFAYFHLHPAALDISLGTVLLFYAIAALCNLRIPDTGARYAKQAAQPLRLLRDFWRCCLALWRDRLGQITLAATTILWGAGATLQFIVLDWAAKLLGMSLSKGANLQAVTAVGVTLGAVVAARVPLKRGFGVLPVGVGLGLLIALGALFTREGFPSGHFAGLSWRLWISGAYLGLIGSFAGFFLVPMNALLQHRGAVLLSAGHSIAVQNFNENLGIIVMLAFYSLLVWQGLNVRLVIALFGSALALVLLMIWLWHRRNQRERDWVALIPSAPAH